MRYPILCLMLTHKFFEGAQILKICFGGDARRVDERVQRWLHRLSVPKTLIRHNDKEDSKVPRRHHEEIRRDPWLQVTVEERTLRRGGWFSGTLHVFGNGGLR
jgi:hypothetical protein